LGREALESGSGPLVVFKAKTDLPRNDNRFLWGIKLSCFGLPKRKVFGWPFSPVGKNLNFFAEGPGFESRGGVFWFLKFVPVLLESLGSEPLAVIRAKTEVTPTKLTRAMHCGRSSRAKLFGSSETQNVRVAI
jgi:hypothetical protein